MKPSEKNLITPALKRFEASRDNNGVVPLSAFERSTLSAAADFALLVRFEGQRTNIRYEWIGHRLPRIYGYDVVGDQITTQLPRKLADDALKSYRQAATTNEPVVERRHLRIKGFIPYGYWRAMLPLAEDEQEISHALVYVVPDLWWITSRRYLREDAI